MDDYTDYKKKVWPGPTWQAKSVKVIQAIKITSNLTCPFLMGSSLRLPLLSVFRLTRLWECFNGTSPILIICHLWPVSEVLSKTLVCLALFLFSTLENGRRTNLTWKDQEWKNINDPHLSNVCMTQNRMSWHIWQNVSQMYWSYFTFPSGKESMENVWKGGGPIHNSWTNLLYLTNQTNQMFYCQVGPGSNSWRLPIGHRPTTCCEVLLCLTKLAKASQ